jgi:site-specific DNA recombinase
MRRAAIYIRVSNEMQSEKASPVEQELDCKEYVESKGYVLTEIYRDIERYRVKGRLVEPSGTRVDRPGLLKLISDAGSNKFDILVAWREDRLYRSLKPLLQVLDLVEEGLIRIELVKEQFDPNMAGIKASIAKMEIDAFRERTHLGVKARLKSGKLWGGHLKYGYSRDGDLLISHPEESKWVRQIFDWYVSGVGVREISRRLISVGAPQKEGKFQTIPWQLSFIYRILNSETYATGIHIVNRDGEIFELPAPIIVDQKIWEKAQGIKEKNKRHPTRHLKRNYLLSGLVTCPCGTKWSAYGRVAKKRFLRRARKVIGDPEVWSFRSKLAPHDALGMARSSPAR